MTDEHDAARAFTRAVHATATDHFITICEPCRRPVRATYPTAERDHAYIRCPGCDTALRADRLYATTSTGECNQACMGATGKSCTCACGGENHAGAFATNYTHNHITATALQAYRDRIAQNEKRAAEKAAREQAAKDAAWSEWAADHTDVVEFLNGYTGQFGFLEDMAALAADRDPLTERQVAAVRKCMVREQERAAKQAAREAARNATPDPAPEGRVTVEGEIVRVTSEPSRYSYHGTDDKMIVDCGHFSVWVTVPSNLVGQLHEDGMIRAGDFWELKGRRVRLTATLTRSDRDPKFAFGKRPRAQLLDIRPASENQ